MSRVHADTDRCQGHGRCSLLAPDVFDVDDHGKVLLLAEEVAEDRYEEVDEAVTSCPESALARL